MKEELKGKNNPPLNPPHQEVKTPLKSPGRNNRGNPAFPPVPKKVLVPFLRKVIPSQSPLKERFLKSGKFISLPPQEPGK